MGFGDGLAAPPELCEAAQLAMHCWDFCAGWHPDTWPIYDAFHVVPDWHALIELMQEIRRNV